MMRSSNRGARRSPDVYPDMVNKDRHGLTDRLEHQLWFLYLKNVPEEGLVPGAIQEGKWATNQVKLPDVFSLVSAKRIRFGYAGAAVTHRVLQDNVCLNTPPG